MSYRSIKLDALLVNRANDRHGELENETAAIAWLFNNFETHMRNLAKDLVASGQVFEPPLVFPEGDHFILFDGNRRMTCLKLLLQPRRAPTIELQEFFAEQRSKWKGDFPTTVQCQIEQDRDRIDDILFRRHTGSQGGVGQSTWDDRMKSNFINRTGRGNGFNAADEIEKRLAEAGMLPTKKMPRSNINRLLSGESFRNRVGFTGAGGKFEFTHDKPVVLRALRRIAQDFASRDYVLGDIWDIDGKRSYLDGLESEGVLPTAANSLASKPVAQDGEEQPAAKRPVPTKISRPQKRVSLIPNVNYSIAWAGRLHRHKAIWEELQFHLNLDDHANAISVLLRVLVELSVENYISQTKLATVSSNDTLARRVLRVTEDLKRAGKIDQKYFELLSKFPQNDVLLSADTLNRYVHSPNFAPSPDHLRALWDWLSDFLVHCLNAPVKAHGVILPEGAAR
ncbi:hypothetical protein RPMA_21990 [Tardiphaga alba]|uniref:ParB/Sulfiredoxin domain-containing protein n=2 Tax=Tardiphaga alba TaxID=340268 RepID=A0ABX8AG45_9BRAD|nr:hypothetical protein RPMA_21990 [Tardiphaga alba]